MKKLILFMLAALSFHAVDAQIFETYKGKLKRLERKLEKDTSDIVLDPIEQIPQGGVTRFSINAEQTNWGSTLLRPQAVVERIKNECKKKVTIKVADTGYKWDHVDLTEGQLPGANYTTDQIAVDGNGHSTHCAGIIAARGFGLAWPLVQNGLLSLKPVQILTAGGSGSFEWFRTAVLSERADDLKRIQAGEAVVWSGSFGGGTSLINDVEVELKKSTDAGVLFVFAAGNTGVTGVNYPGRSPYGIAVGSLDNTLGVSSYSTRGQEVFIGAPGRGINSTYKGNTYAVLSGTSMATPAEAAILAIALSKWGTQYLGSVSATKAYLAWCASDLPPTGKDDNTGYGLDYIVSVLDKDPAKTPGVVNPPPPPPVHSLRYLTFDLAGDYTITWNVQAQSQKPTTYKTSGRGSRPSKAALENKKAYISRVVLEVETVKQVNDQYELTSSELKKYLSGRGFTLIEPGSDGADAVFWASYFLEMSFSQALKEKVLVLEITGKNETGTPFVWKKDRLKHWPSK